METVLAIILFTTGGFFAGHDMGKQEQQAECSRPVLVCKEGTKCNEPQ